MKTGKIGWFKRTLSMVLALAMSVSTGVTAAFAEEERPETAVTQISAPLEDGVYYTQVDLWNATSNQPSMGNGALRGSSSFQSAQPGDSAYESAIVVVENGKATALVEYMPMGFIGMYGFMLQLDSVKVNHLQQWGGIYEGDAVYTPGRVLSKHLTAEGAPVFDAYNNPDSSDCFVDKALPDGYGRPSGSTLNLSNKAYPHLIAVDATPIFTENGVDVKPTSMSEYTWKNAAYVHVFVPIMYTIMPTSGDQHARLKVDWAGAKKIENPDEVLEYALWKSAQITRGNYTEESFGALQSKIAEIQKKLDNVWPSQSLSLSSSQMPELNQKEFTAAEKKAMAKELTDAVSALKVQSADYTAVDAALATVPADLTVYTDETAAAVKAAVAAVDKSLDLTEQTEVNAMAEAVEKAVAGLKLKDEFKFDKNDLEDGVYAVSVDMVKTNGTDPSMSNSGISHTAKLTVKDGKYDLTVNFKGISFLNKFGYLAKLSYYTDGYTYTGKGTIEGTRLDAKVLTTQKTYDGKDVVDDFNKEGGVFAGGLYPETVNFPVVSGVLADSDDFVPLHVFVPVMEDIAAGTGDQDVLMKLDWSSLRKTTADDPAFVPEKPEAPSPAVDYTDKATGVRVTAEAGVFPEGVKPVITRLTSGKAYDAAVKALNEVGRKNAVYDIHFEDANGRVVEPDGFVTVSVPIGETWKADKVELYRVTENGKTRVAGAADDGAYTAVLKYLGVYGIVEAGSTEAEPVVPSEPTAPESGKTPNTGDLTDLSLLLAAVLLTGAASAFGAYKKMNSHREN